MGWVLGMIFGAALSPVFAATEAEKAMWAGRVEEALPIARREALAALEDLDAQERFIDVLQALGMAATATEVYRARLESRPGDPASTCLLGRALADAKFAEQAYRLGLSLDPTSARCHLGIAAVNRVNGKYVDAESEYAIAAERDPHLGEAWAGLAQTRMLLGQRDAALVAARAGVQHAPGAAESYLILTVLAPNEAAATLARAVATVPEDPRVHAALAEHYLSRGDGVRAAKSAAVTLALDPSHGGAALSAMFADALQNGRLDVSGYRQLVALRVHEGADPKKTAIEYDKLVIRYPTSSLPRLAAARLAQAAGDRARALDLFAGAASVEPHNIEACALYGLALVEAGRMAEARPWLDRALAARPRDVSILLGVARAEAKLDGLARAIPRLEEAERRWPHEARIPLLIAELFSAERKNEEAYRALRAALDRMPDPRLILPFTAAAVLADHRDEAFQVVDAVARRTGDAKMKDLAEKLRTASK